MSEELRTGFIELKHGELTASIATQGAWLERAEGASGPILFPKTEIPGVDGSLKVRGGCHVCLPNFGPGGETGLKQHGFGRDENWLIVDQSDANVSLSLDVAEGEYAGLSATISYQLLTSGIEMSLAVHNTGNNELVIAPGFHPYFPNSESAININDSFYDTNDLANPQQFTAEAASLQAGTTQFGLKSSNLSQWVVWTDKLGDYVCVEPTQSGASFADGNFCELGIALSPGDIWDCGLSINT